jgi:hypothetical protein
VARERLLMLHALNVEVLDFKKTDERSRFLFLRVLKMVRA